MTDEEIETAAGVTASKRYRRNAVLNIHDHPGERHEDMTNEEWNAWSDQSWASMLTASDNVNTAYLAEADARTAELATTSLDPCSYVAREADADCDY